MKLIRLSTGKKIYKVKKCSGLSSLRGLMFDNMEKYDGALIEAGSIWMPFIKMPLNLVFLDREMNVIRSQVADPISLKPGTWKTYTEYSAKYCLELKDTRLRLKPGTRIKML